MPRLRRNTLLLTLVFAFSLAQAALTADPARQIDADPETLAAAGIRKLDGKYISIYTDLPADAEVDKLPQIFDKAVPEWARFFGEQKDVFDGWHVDARVIQNKQRFRDFGLLPDDLPPFLHGLQKFDDLWVHEQPSAYYRRHLLLHEGTHAAMNRIFGRVGPAWYREGIAEFLGTHHVIDGKPKLGNFPANKQEVEHWGRIKIIKDELSEGKLQSISNIVSFQSRDYLNVESYAWSWALQSFGQRHPEFKSIFHELADEMYVSSRRVTHHFLRRYYERQHEFDTAWYAFLRHLEYGYDSRGERIDHDKPFVELGDGVVAFKIDSTRGWQSTGIKLSPNTSIDIASRTRFQVASETGRDGKIRPWISEPQGVTIEYYKGRPLGVLLAAIVNPEEPDTAKALANPKTIGRLSQMRSVDGGILYVRINERTDRMSDNKGEISVSVRRRKD